MITKESVKRFIGKSVTHFGKLLTKPSWWVLFPKEGNPLIISKWELLMYVALFVLFGFLFKKINEIPREQIIIHADKLENARYVKSIDDSLSCLMYQKANLTLRIPMTFTEDTTREMNDDGRISLNGAIQYDSLQFVKHDLSIPNDREYGRNELIEKPISNYWKAVIHNANGDSIEKYLMTVPDQDIVEVLKIYEQLKSVGSSVKTNFMASRKWIRDELNPKFTDSYFLGLECGWPSGDSLEQEYGRKNLENNPPRPISETGNCNLYIAYRLHDYKKHHLHYFYCRKTPYENSQLIGKRNENRSEWYYLGRNDYLINQPNPAEHDMSDNYGWFSLNDVSQGYYWILLRTSTIDSLSLTIDFVGAVNLWPSVTPDEAFGSSITYNDPLKILQIRSDGLRVYYESKELASKQSMRIFAVTAVLSGLFMILITFIILVSARYVKSQRNRNN